MSTTPEAVRAWIDADPDPTTRDELAALLARAESGDGDDAAAARADLDSRFVGPLEFGTAGLRGALGAGPHRMNRAVVIQAAAGLAAFLAEKVGPGFSVVIGYDHRYGSTQFAQDTAAVVTAAGGRARLLPSALPTPVLAFSVRHLGADAGVMVTASHNPREDNGYKVYLGGRAVTGSGEGAQIVPPFDAEISAKIAAVGPAAQVPLAADGWEVLGSEIEDAYVARAVSLIPRRHTRDLRIVLTPMHGVGGRLTKRVLNKAGFEDVRLVPAQADPDPDFPTVAFPNPEEPGALDLAMAMARDEGAHLVLATDPDADRCSAAIRDRSATGGWRQLTGDEIGSLLGDQTGVVAAMAGPGVLASSVVSSRLLAKIARAHGLQHRTTLTGFKWISRTENLAFGYEEAIGYCVDPAGVRDKDGISAALRLAYLAAQLHDRGATFVDALDDLAHRFGLHATSPYTVRVQDLAVIGETMARLRTTAPQTLAGSPVVSVTDLAAGSPELPPTDGLVYLTAADDRVVIRPSGTEPKLKAYLEVILPVGDEPVGGVRERAAARLALLKDDVAALVGITTAV